MHLPGDNEWIDRHKPQQNTAQYKLSSYFPECIVYTFIGLIVVTSQKTIYQNEKKFRYRSSFPPEESTSLNASNLCF